MALGIVNIMSSQTADTTYLDDVSNAVATAQSKSVELTWTDPEDIRFNGATLAAWGGTLVVRKEGSAPEDKDDGTVVIDSTTRNAYSETPFVDSGLTNGVTYYYKFFPYDTVGAYVNGTTTVSARPEPYLVDLPTVVGEFTYDGQVKTPTTTYDSTAVNATGDLTSTNAGTKTITFSLKSDLYVWRDGSTENKTRTWSIAKANNNLVLSKTSGTVTYGSSTSFTVSTNTSGGTLSVSSADNNYAEALLSGNAVTVRCTNYRSSTTVVTVTSAATANYNAATATFTMTAAKANGSVTLSKTSETVNYGSSTTFSVTGNTSGGTLSVSSADTSCVTVSLSGTTVTANCVKCKDTPTVITVTSAATNNYNAATATFSFQSAKVAGSVTLSKSSISLSADTPSTTFTVTRSGDGAITVTSNNLQVCTVSGTSTVTVTGVNSGSATITVSVAEGTNHLAASANVAVTASMISNVLNENSWSTISQVAQAGTGDTYWDVGDCKEITLNGNVGSALTLSNTKLCVFILHFNYPTNKTTAMNNIVFGGFKTAVTGGVDVALVDAKLYNTTSAGGAIFFNMNHSGNVNYGGWKGSDLRYDILGATSTQPSDYGKTHTTSCVGYDATSSTLTSPKANTLLAAFPSDLRSKMRLWTRYVDNVGNSSNVNANVTACVDAISLLAEFEVFGGRSHANDYEKNHQVQMAYYSAGNSKAKYRHTDTSSTVYWWECSPNYNDITAFCDVIGDGIASCDSARNVYAVAPAFIV